MDNVAFRNYILDAVNGSSGEIRINCSNPDCRGSQSKTLCINADNGGYECKRCGIKGNFKNTPKPFPERKSFPLYVWDSAQDCITHPYLEKKKVKNYGGKLDKFGKFLIRFSINGKITTCQTIDSTGGKKFLPKAKGCQAKGASFIIWGTLDRVYVCEGYATGASIYEATGCTVIIVGMKSNFIPSFESLKEKFSGSEIIFCADNDKDDGGLRYCINAAKKFNAKVAMPETVGKDFNDLHVEQGLDVVRDQLSQYIDVEQSFKTQIKLDRTADATETMQESGIDHRAVVNAAYEGQKGCANMLVNLNRGAFCYDRAAGLWYEFSGHCWELDKLGKIICSCDMIQEIFKRSLAEIEAAILEMASEIRQANDEQKRQLQALIKKLEAEQKAVFIAIHNLNALSFRKQTVDFAAHGSNSLGITGEEWDQKPWDLAVKNGIVDLKTGELKPGAPEDFIKSPCPTVYDPSATCPSFEKFLLDVFDNDMATVDFLRLLLGAGLIGIGTLKQFIIIFSGLGRNGKDTLMSVIQYVLGLCLAAPIPAELVLDGGANGKRSSQGPSADLMKLRGLRFASANETSQGRSFNSGVAKQLSGGGLMTARAPFGKANVDWEMTHMIILMTNSRPKAPVDDYAFWKRIKAVHFPLSFVTDPKEPHERKADPHIGEKLRAEASGILNFLVQGCLDYQKYGLTESAAVRAEHSAYLKDVDLTGIFIDECCFQGRAAIVTAKALYAAYRVWAQESGYRPVSGKVFGQYISKRFEAGHTRNGNIYSGIDLLTREGCEGL